MFRSVVFILAFIGTCLGAELRNFNKNIRDREYYEEKFYDWLVEHPELKPSDGESFSRMLNNFADTDDRIEISNTQGLSYTLGHNQFSALSEEEFRKLMRLDLYNYFYLYVNFGVSEFLIQPTPSSARRISRRPRVTRIKCIEWALLSFVYRLGDFGGGYSR